MSKRDRSPSTKAVAVSIAGVMAGIGIVSYGMRCLVKSGKISFASAPTDLSWRGWKRALLQTKNAIGNKNLAPLAASIAYGGTLAFFPLVVACVAIASMVINPDDMRDIVDGLSSYLPGDIAGLLSAQLSNAIENKSANSIVAVAAIALALFGVSGAMNSLVNALNVAYERHESRGIIKVRLISLGLTCMMVVGFLIILPLIALGSNLLRSIGTPELLITVFSIGRWAILALVMALGLSVVYRYAPDRPNARWQWVSWGALIATALWLIVTALFFIYVQNFANFSDSYSLFAGIIVLMMWINFTGLIVLIGAEVNHQLEKRTIIPTV